MRHTLRSVDEVFEVLGGPKSVAEIVGFSRNRVDNWLRFGRFPSDTYLVIRRPLYELGYDAPPNLWGMLCPNRSEQNNSAPKTLRRPK